MTKFFLIQDTLRDCSEVSRIRKFGDKYIEVFLKDANLPIDYIYDSEKERDSAFNDVCKRLLDEK